jgi:hypothetical protein
VISVKFQFVRFCSAVRAAVIGALQVYASDAYTLPGNPAVLPCLVMLPVEQAWAVEVTHWTASSGPNNQHLVDSHSIPQRKFTSIRCSLLIIIHSGCGTCWTYGNPQNEFPPPAPSLSIAPV